MSVRRLFVSGGATLRDLVLAFAAATSVVLFVLVVAGVLSGAAFADTCPNAVERFGPSANLPDCRAYELVSPRVKGDDSTLSEIHGFADGNHVFYSSLLPLPGSSSGEEEMVLSSRTPEGWITTPLTVPAGPGEPFGFNGGKNGLAASVYGHMVSFASDFSSAFVNSPLQYGELDQNKQWNVFRVLVPSGAASIESLPDSGPMTEALINPPNNGAEVPGSLLAGNSGDGSRAYFETNVNLPVASGSPEDTHTSGYELFERHAGHTYVVGILPDGSVAPCGAEIGSAGAVNGPKFHNGSVISAYGAVSTDGTNVVFVASPSCSEPSKAYLRIDNGRSDARTVELPGRFFTRTTDQQKLLLSGEEGHIYEYDIASGQATVVGSGELIGYSADGSHVYSSPGRGLGENLLVYEDGVLKQTLIPGSGVTGERLPGAQAGDEPVASPDGTKLVFVDKENLTSYNSNGFHEVYVYDATTGSVLCVSCNPDGSPPFKHSGLLAWEKPEGDEFFSQVEGLADPLNAFTPGDYPAISTDDKHVFFGSREGLVPQDTNGLEDVYEWEEAGTGTCGVANLSYSKVSGGCVSLISSGTGSNGSWITGASEDGSNVFFVSNDNLAPQVDEAAQEIYDARVDGGFPYTPPAYGCDSGQCQGPQTPVPPLLAPPPSATFVGVGNPTSEPSVTAKSKGRKPVKHKKRKHKVKGKHGKRGKRKGRR